MQPSQRYQDLVKHCNYNLNVIGFAILTPKIQISYRSFLTMTVIVSFAFCGSRYMIKRSEVSWAECLKASIMMGGMLNGVTEVITLTLRRPEIRGLILSTVQLYKDYEQRSEAYCRGLNVAIDRVLEIKKIIRIGYFLSYFVMSVVPLIILFYNGERVTIVQQEFPYLSLDDNFGYTFTYIAQFGSMFCAGVGFYAADLLGCIALTQIITYADILEIKAQKLNSLLDRKVETRRTAEVGAKFERDNEVTELLLEAIKWHQLLTEYSRHVDHTFHIMITGQVLSAAFSLLSTTCVNLNAFHLISAIYFVVSAYKLFVFCIVGTKIEYAYDQIYDSICNINWHELNGAQRNMYGMMLKDAQNSQTMIMLGLFPLSWRTALNITKLIYSLSMMMGQNRT